MRPSLLVLAAFLATVITSPAASAAAPGDPFVAAPQTQPDTHRADPPGLADPFSATPASETAPAILADPFTVAPAPACPSRASANGVLIQRPSTLGCRTEPLQHQLIDPFAA